MVALALPRLTTVPAAVPSSSVIRRAVTFSPRLSDWSVTPVWMLISAASSAGSSGASPSGQRVGLALEGQHAGDGALGVAPHQAAAAVGGQVDPADDAVDGQRRVAGAERDVGDRALGPGPHAADVVIRPLALPWSPPMLTPGMVAEASALVRVWPSVPWQGSCLGTMSPMWAVPPTRSASAAQPEPPITRVRHVADDLGVAAADLQRRVVGAAGHAVDTEERHAQRQRHGDGLPGADAGARVAELEPAQPRDLDGAAVLLEQGDHLVERGRDRAVDEVEQLGQRPVERRTGGRHDEVDVERPRRSVVACSLPSVVAHAVAVVVRPLIVSTGEGICGFCRPRTTEATVEVLSVPAAMPCFVVLYVVLLAGDRAELDQRVVGGCVDAEHLVGPGPCRPGGCSRSSWARCGPSGARRRPP